MLTSGNGQNVNAIDHIELSRYPSEAEIKKGSSEILCDDLTAG